MTALRGPFRFDAARHTYTVGGVVVPGIHAVLRAGGLEPSGASYYTEEHRERGRVVHAATLAYDLGAPVDVPDEWMGYFTAYVQFLSEVRCRWRLLEHPMVHRRLRYASVIDRVGTVSGRPAVFEVKTGGEAEFHGPQLAGADILVEGRVRLGLRRRLAVYLQADGSYRLREYESAADYQRFLGAVAAYWTEEE